MLGGVLAGLLVGCRGVLGGLLIVCRGVRSGSGKKRRGSQQACWSGSGRLSWRGFNWTAPSGPKKTKRLERLLSGVAGLLRVLAELGKCVGFPRVSAKSLSSFFAARLS